MIVAALVAVALITVGTVLVTRPKPEHGPTDMAGNRVALDPGTVPGASARQAMDPESDTGHRFRVAAVGLDVPLGAVSMVDRSITPPGFASAYLVRNMGVTPQKATTGTVFVAMHSLRDGAVGPGNYLVDVRAARARVKAGTRIRVGAQTYAVTGSRTIGKSEIAKDRAVWKSTRGRLVVITCLQRPGGGRSLENVVITARLTSASADATPTSRSR